MTDKEKEAVETMQHWIEYEKANKEKINKADELIEIQETVLNLLQTQQEEIEQSNKVIDKRNEKKIELVEICLKKDKIIDEMAKYIEDESTVDEFCSKENCYADDYENGHCRKCLNCIKKYFINKAEEEN